MPRVTRFGGLAVVAESCIAEPVADVVGLEFDVLEPRDRLGSGMRQIGRLVCSLLWSQEIGESLARRGWRREEVRAASWFRAKVDAVNFWGGVSRAATTLALQEAGRDCSKSALRLWHRAPFWGNCSGSADEEKVHRKDAVLPNKVPWRLP